MPRTRTKADPPPSTEAVAAKCLRAVLRLTDRLTAAQQVVFDRLASEERAYRCSWKIKSAEDAYFKATDTASLQRAAAQVHAERAQVAEAKLPRNKGSVDLAERDRYVHENKKRYSWYQLATKLWREQPEWVGAKPGEPPTRKLLALAAGRLRTANQRHRKKPARL